MQATTTPKPHQLARPRKRRMKRRPPPRKTAWQSFPWPVRWFIMGSALVFLGSAAILATAFLIGMAGIS